MSNSDSPMGSSELTNGQNVTQRHAKDQKLYVEDIDAESNSSEDRDAVELSKLGKKQVLRRGFGFWSMLGLNLSATVTWEAQFAVLAFALNNGGTAGVIYEYIYTWIGYLCMFASLAELASIAPVAGGQYHWVYMFAPPSCRNFLSYLTGWHTVLYYQTALASAAYISGTMIQGLLILNYPDYKAQLWQGTLLMYAIMVIPTLINVALPKYLPKVEGIVLFLHVALFPCYLIPILVLAPTTKTASEVFTGIVSATGYESAGLAFLVGCATGDVFAFLGADAACHMSEESRNPSKNIPWIIINTILINGALGFAMNVALVFCMGNIQDALSSRTGYPFMEILTHVTSSRGSGTALAAILVIAFEFATLAVLAACSRMTWAFARDKGLPGSRWLGRVEPNLKIPLYSVALTVLVTVVLAPINIGSTETFAAFLSLSVSGSLGASAIPIAVAMYRRFKDPDTIKPGPFSLGWSRWPVNIIGLTWTVVSMFFSFWPEYVPVTQAKNMNWSCLLYGAMLIFASLFYALYARFRYNGPIIETNLGAETNGNVLDGSPREKVTVAE